MVAATGTRLGKIQENLGKIQEIVYELMVRDVMSKELVTVEPRVPVSDLREVLRAKRISGVPVVDEGELVGIISVEDFIKCLADRQNGCGNQLDIVAKVPQLLMPEAGDRESVNQR